MMRPKSASTWLPTNHHVELAHRQRYEEAERRHLAQVTGTLQTTRKNPDEGNHLRANMKQIIAREVETAQIEHANMLLLAKLHKTVHRPASAGMTGLGTARKGQRSMNIRLRQKEFQRIERENEVRWLFPAAPGTFLFLLLRPSHPRATPLTAPPPPPFLHSPSAFLPSFPLLCSSCWSVWSE